MNENYRNNPSKVNSIKTMITNAVYADPNHIAYKWLNDKDVEQKTNAELLFDIEHLGGSLITRGYSKKHIACIGENSYKWVLTFLTVMSSDNIFVPIDRELAVNDVISILNESDTQLLFCDNRWEKRIRENIYLLPDNFKVVSFELKESDDRFFSFDEIIKICTDTSISLFRDIKPITDKLKYLVYTSGTTGKAKGVMLSEHNVCCGVYYGMKVSSVLNVGMSVLPMNHTYEAVCDILVAIHSHATICINDTLRNIQKNMLLFSPDYILLVPAISEHFVKVINASINKSGRAKKFAKTVKLSNSLRKIGIDLRRVFFKELHEKFGGNLRKIVCGGAPIRADVGKFFDDIGITLTGGYGITECSPLVSVNDDKSNNFSSAGHRVACLEWRIDNPDADGIGEICVKGDVVMLGYYKRDDLTREVFLDGWFKTGDYGYINDNDEIVITGRKKNIIVLNNGKNVFPEEIEEKIMSVPYINEVVVYGEENMFNQISTLSAEVYCEEEKNSKEVLTDIRDVLCNEPSYKQVHSVKLRNEPFDKTTTNKIKRK